MKYGFTVKQCMLDGEKLWVAQSTDLKGCVAQGETVDEAISELTANEEVWIAIAEECGLEIPEPSVEMETEAYSGKLTLRLGPRLHRETAECAKKDGLSINSYITNAIASYNSTKSAAGAIAQIIEAVESHPLKRFQITSKFYANVVVSKSPNYAFVSRS